MGAEKFDSAGVAPQRSLSFAEFLVLADAEFVARTAGAHATVPRPRADMPPGALLLRDDDVRAAAAALVALGLLAGPPEAAVMTPAGLEALEPYRVKRAVVLAAGTGTRLYPATLTTPKPLVSVKGSPLIHSALKLLSQAGITDVCVVRGYLGSQLDRLLAEFPFVRFVDNPDYYENGNITSLAVVKERLGGSYIMDADLVLANPNLVMRYQYWTNYLGIPLERAQGWCFSSADGVVTGAGTQVCEGVHQIVGVSYWSEEDGARLGRDLERVLAEPNGDKRYWDEVAVACFPDDYVVHVHPCAARDVIEIDTFEELCAIEPSYAILAGQTAAWR